jgi:hypothetical protein
VPVLVDVLVIDEGATVTRALAELRRRAGARGWPRLEVLEDLDS